MSSCLTGVWKIIFSVFLYLLCLGQQDCRSCSVLLKDCIISTTDWRFRYIVVETCFTFVILSELNIVGVLIDYNNLVLFYCFVLEGDLPRFQIFKCVAGQAISSQTFRFWSCKRGSYRWQDSCIYCGKLNSYNFSLVFNHDHFQK